MSKTLNQIEPLAQDDIFPCSECGGEVGHRVNCSLGIATSDAWGDVPPYLEVVPAGESTRTPLQQCETELHNAELTISQLRADLEQVEAERDAQGLTLATLADMVLGEDAADRSDDALVRAVRMLIRERNEAQARSGAKSIALGLTLATLADMVLGEDAADRSDDALVRAVRTLIRERNEAQAKLAQYEGDDKRWHSFETVQAIVKERDAALIEAGDLRLRLAAEANARGVAVDVFKRVSSVKRAWRKRAEQAEAELVEAQSRLIAGEVYEKLDSINYWKTRAEQAEAALGAAKQSRARLVALIYETAKDLYPYAPDGIHRGARHKMAALDEAMADADNWKARAEKAEADARALASLCDRYHVIDLIGNEEGAGMWSAFIAKYLEATK